MGEAGIHLAARGQAYLTETCETWLSLKRFGREDEADNPFGRDLRRPNRDGRDHEDLADGRPIPWEHSHGRTLLQLTLKPRSVKLIHHQELGNATLSSIHIDKRAQQGRPIRII